MKATMTCCTNENSYKISVVKKKEIAQAQFIATMLKGRKENGYVHVKIVLHTSEQITK